MRNKWLIRCFLPVCLCLPAVIFAACGKRGTEPEEEMAAKPEDVWKITEDIWSDQDFTYFKEHPVNEGHAVELSMWVNEDWKESYSYLLEEYKKYRPNVTVKLTCFPWKSYWIKLRLAMENENGPDMFHMHNAYGRDFKENMLPLPESVFGEDCMEQVFPQPPGIRMEGSLYYVGLGKATGGIFYNKEMWKAAGFTESDIPKTWEQLAQTAEKLTRYDANGNIIVDGFNFNGEMLSLLFAMQAQKGLTVFSEEGYGPNLNDAANISNLDYINQLCGAEGVCRPNEAPAHELLGKGGAAMIYGWSWVANYLDQNHPGTEYGFFRTPCWDEAVPPAYDYNNYESSFAVNRASSPEKQDAALDLLLFYLCSDAVLVRTARQAQMVPAKEILLTEHGEELGEVIQIQSSYIDRTAFKGVVPEAVYACLSPLMTRELWDPGNNREEMLQNMDEEISRILKSYQFEPQMKHYVHYGEFHTEED